MESTAETRRAVRKLLRQTGRGFAETLGFTVTNSPANLFQLLCLSIVLRNITDYRVAGHAVRALRDQGLDSPARMARSSHEERLHILRDNGIHRKPAYLAATIGDLAQTVLERYSGDLRRLRTRAKQDRDRERRLLRELAGVDDAVVDLFFREVQAPWREVAPFADKRALGAARRLGLGRSADDLATLTGGVDSERIAWLVGILVRIDLDNRYGEVWELAPTPGS